MNQKVEIFFSKKTKWQKEYEKLRAIIMGCGLTEDFKWMHPCYSLEDANIVLIHGFKEYCALLFFKGVLMNDKKEVLIQQTKNVQEARQIRFTNLQEINDLEETIKAYVIEAIKIERAGLKVEMKKTIDYEVPEELLHKFKEDAAFKTAFNALTPGRQKGYLLHFSQPKQSKTKTSRIEKNIENILKGKGLND